MRSDLKPVELVLMEKTIDVLVFGHSGQVAQSLVDAAALLSLNLITIGRPHLDIAQFAQVKSKLENIKPKIVINAAAYTAVDKAETDMQNAKHINADAASNIAKATYEAGIPFIHISTDYVFDGTKKTPYVESDQTNPQGVYGHTKLMGEDNVLRQNPQSMIARTSWVYSKYGSNFIKTMLRLGREKPQMSIVSDQFGSPTSAFDLAYGLLQSAIKIINHPKREMFGIFHASGRGSASWFDLADYTFLCAQSHGYKAPQVIPVSTAEFKTAAMRPANSRLLTSKFEDTFDHRFPHWTMSVENVVKDILKHEFNEAQY